MALFNLNPLGAIAGVLRSVARGGLDSIAQPIGGLIGRIGRALGQLGTSMEAAAIRRELEREAEIKRQSDAALGVSVARPLTDADIPEAATKLRRKYSYTVRIESIDPLTGRRVERFITISSDRLRSDEEIFGQATDGFAEGYGVTESNIIRISIEGIKRAGAAGTL